MLGDSPLSSSGARGGAPPSEFCNFSMSAGMRTSRSRVVLPEPLHARDADKTGQGNFDGQIFQVVQIRAAQQQFVLASAGNGTAFGNFNLLPAAQVGAGQRFRIAQDFLARPLETPPLRRTRRGPAPIR